MAEHPPRDPDSVPPHDPRPLEPELEQVFGLGSTEDWIEHARRASQAADAPLGDLGPYRLLAEIGRGSQGVVYKAVQPGTQRLVAIKRLAIVGIGGGTRSAERFSREVDAATRLAHPNIVAVYAADVIDSHAVIVMEWIDGPPIDRWADAVWSGTGPADREKLRQVLEAFALVCDAVSHAHQRGVIHRDLKPNNILVDPEGRPRVVDFGVAKVIEDWRAQAATPDPGYAWTATGFAGTPAYCPPEQLSDGPRPPDTRADVYALGVILYRLACGVDAFGHKKGIADLLDAVRCGPQRRPSQVRPGLGREVDCIVGKAMEGEPERRYQTVESLAEDVRRLLDGRALLAHPPSLSYLARRAIGRRPMTSAGIAVAVVLVTGLALIAAVQAVRLSARSADLAAALETATRLRASAEASERRQSDLNRSLLMASMGAASRTTFFYPTDFSPVDALGQIVNQLTPDVDDATAAELRMRLGFALSAAGRHSEAVDTLTEAQTCSDRVDPPTSERAVHIAMRRSWSLRSAGRGEEALTCIDRAIARASAAGPPTLYSAALHWERTSVLSSLKRPADAVASARQLVLACDAVPEQRSERSRARETLANTLLDVGQFSEAAAVMEEGIRLGTASRVDGQSMSRFRNSLGFALAAQRQWAAAEAAFGAAANYRLGIDTAAGSRAHRYLARHAEALHRLGRFSDAAARWELSLIRSLAKAKPDQRYIAALRLRLGAARLGAGQTAVGRQVLALALSTGRTQESADALVDAKLREVEAALGATKWQIDDSLAAALGELEWMLHAADEVVSFGAPQSVTELE